MICFIIIKQNKVRKLCMMRYISLHGDQNTLNFTQRHSGQFAVLESLYIIFINNYIANLKIRNRK